MSASKLELDCTSRCRSPQHGNAIVSSLSVRGASEAAKAAYMRSTCTNYCQIIDVAGRTALHMAASTGCYSVVRWLAQHKESNINVKDVESGYSPLHRSVFYGQIHVAASLIQLGANLSALDNDDFTAIDHAMMDRLPIVDFSVNNPCEVYVWGTNANYTLGTGNQHNRLLPELLEAFRKQNISIKQTAMHKFHSVFVAHNGQAYSCGHGQGGRLGLGTEQAVLTPCPIKLGVTKNLTPELCAAASVSRDHTVLLTDTGAVLTCGLNSHHQLGISPPPSHLISPTLVPLRALKAQGAVSGVCASRFHTVVWGPKAVLTFGLHAGQLGHPRGTDKTIVRPKVVASLNLNDATITKVSSSDGATVVVTDKGHMFVLHEYQCRRIASRQTDVAKVVVVGGHLDSRLEKDILMEQGGDALKVLVLTTAGKLLIWQETSPQLIRCVYTLNRLILLKDVAMTRNQLLLVTRDGEAFTGEIKVKKPKKLSPEQSPKPTSSSRSLERVDCEVIRVTRLPHVHRAISITSDVKGRNFALIQTHPKQALFDVPQLETMSMREHMKNLLQEADEYDTIHDVVFRVGFRNFSAHQYIISSRNETLGKLIADQVVNSSLNGAVKVVIDDVQSDLFEQILQYIYTNECDMMILGKCPTVAPEATNGNSEMIGQDLLSEDRKNVSAFAVYSAESKKGKKNKGPAPKTNNVSNEWDPVKLLQKTARKFKMQDLCNELDGFSFEDGFVVPKSKRTKAASQPKWDRAVLDQLHDVVIRSENGRELGAHKCVLASRLEYFHSMLSQGWSETSKNKNTLNLALPFEILEILVDFLYKDDVSPTVRDSEDINLLSNLLVVADQLFVQRLKEQCEVSLVNVLTLKNAAELLQMADTYIAKQLKSCCMQYICLNLSAILELRSLEGVSADLLSELSRYYCNLNPLVNKRVITPYSYAPTVETLNAAFDTNPFTFEVEDSAFFPDDTLKKALKQAKKKPRVRKNSNEASKTIRLRNESTSSIASDDLDQVINAFSFSDLVEKSPVEENITSNIKESSEKNLQWVKISSTKQQKIVQARLKAINISKESSFIAESTRESFTKLTRSSQSPVPASVPSVTLVSTVPPVQRALSDCDSPFKETSEKVIIPVKPIMSFDFPDLCSPPNSQHSFSTHHKSDKITPKKIVKMSQKQRKRLTSVNDTSLIAEHLDTINQSPPPPAWGRQSPEKEAENYSLVDIIRHELKQVKLSPVVPIVQQLPPTVDVPVKGAAMNPWSKVPTPEVAVIRQKPVAKSAISFTAIVADEKKQKDNLSKMLSKPLEFTQIEDQAISDLLQFYNAKGATEERITVQRVNIGPIATPTWITNH